MKAMIMTVAISFVVAAVPFALAEEDMDCYNSPPSEGVKHPLQEKRYLYVVSASGEFRLEKFGEWQDTNGQSGLQTERCFAGGTEWYVKDKKTSSLP